MLEFNFHPFPELSTGRLLLRQLDADDAAELFFLRSDPGVLLYLHKEPAKTIKEVRDFIGEINADIDENEVILWGICLKEDSSTIIGTVCFWQIRKEHYRAELGYVLHPRHWNKGIMKEAIQKVIAYGFSDMKLHSIDANIDPGNIASAALLESLGFSRDAYFRENVFFKGEFGDTVVYSLVNNEGFSKSQV